MWTAIADLAARLARARLRQADRLIARAHHAHRVAAWWHDVECWASGFAAWGELARRRARRLAGRAP